MKFPIGAILESFCMPTDDAVRRVAELGAHFTEEELTAAVEADIAFSKEVNATKSELLE